MIACCKARILGSSSSDSLPLESGDDSVESPNLYLGVDRIVLKRSTRACVSFSTSLVSELSDNSAFFTCGIVSDARVFFLPGICVVVALFR